MKPVFCSKHTQVGLSQIWCQISTGSKYVAISAHARKLTKSNRKRGSIAKMSGPVRNLTRETHFQG